MPERFNGVDYDYDDPNAVLMEESWGGIDGDMVVNQEELEEALSMLEGSVV